MSLKVDKVQLEIIMKSDTTRAEIGKLEQQAALLKKQMQGLKRNSEEYIRLSSEYGKVRGQIDKLRNSIDLNAKTMRELTQRARELRTMMNNLTPGTDKWNQYNKELQMTNARMKELRTTGQKTESWFSSTAGRFNKYFALLGTSVAAITGVSMTFRKLAEDVAKMDDVYSDVMKTTGNTKEQVLELNEEFKKMDTRTAREQLNMLARDAGKLGLSSKKDILDFVEAGNQINVALGEDLGEGAIRDVGKLVDVFTRSTDHLQKLDLKGKMLAVGSAINELGASSTANEKYLVNFMGRLGGVSAQAGISADAVMGYASALDQDMQAVEMSATALQKFIMKLMGEPAKFAQIAGLEVKAFTDLMQTDVNAAMKQVLRALNEKGGFQQLIPIFQEMGLDGARAVGVLSAMASSIDKIDEAQRIANEAMIEGTSLTDEYNIKNENLAARLDKARKAFKEQALELGQKLNPILLKSTNLSTNLIKVLTKYPGVIKILIGMVGTLAAIYGILLAEKIKNNIALKANLVLEKASFISTNALATAKHLLAGNTMKAAVSWHALNTAMKANVILFAISVVTALGVGLYKLITRTSDAEKATKALNQEYAKEKGAIQSLIDEYNDVNTKKERKIAIINQLETVYGIYLDDLKTEEGLITDIAEAQDRANRALMNNLALKAKQEGMDSANADYLGKQKDNLAKFKEAMEKAGLSEYQQKSFAQKVNQMFLNSGTDTNKTIRLATDYMEEQGVTVTKGMTKAIQKMASATTDYLVAKRKVDETFETFLAEDSNMLNTFTVTAPKKKTGDDSTTSLGDNKDKGKKNDPTDEAIGKAEENYKKELLALKNSLIEKEITEKKFAEKGEALTLDYLNNKLEIQKQYGKSTVDTETEIAEWKLRKQKTDDELLLEDIKQSNDARLKALDVRDALEKEKLQDLVDDKQITNREYQNSLIEIELSAAQSRTLIAEDYLKLVEQGEFHSAEAKKKAVDEATKAVEQAAKDEEKAVKAANRAKLKSEEDFQRERENLLKSLGILTIREQYELEKKELDKHLADKLLSEEEYAEAVRKLKIEKTESYAQQAVDFAGYVADAVSSYHQLEADSLEAEKQRELAAAGDNAEERERIEAEYAQKELDLKKKQANADAGVKIAQTVAAGALAAIQAFAQLGPIGGAIAAALIAVTTGLQIASIIKQRNAIMATTLDSPGTSSAPAKTGRIVTKQAADGRYDVVGADDGRTYRNVPYTGVAKSGFVTTPTLVGERGDELIISNPHLRNIRMNAPHLISQMMSYRVPQRAEGKYNAITPTPEDRQLQEIVLKNTEVMARTVSLLKDLKNNGVKAPIVLSELEKKQALRDKSSKIGSK